MNLHGIFAGGGAGGGAVSSPLIKPKASHQGRQREAGPVGRQLLVDAAKLLLKPILGELVLSEEHEL